MISADLIVTDAREIATLGRGATFYKWKLQVRKLAGMRQENVL